MAIPSNVLEIRYSKIYNRLVKEDIKIASLSDIHISDTITNEDIDFMIESINKERPNYICVLGDIIDYPRIIENNINRLKCIKLFVGLSKISPVYIIFGNHDYINYDKNDNYQENYKEDFWNEIASLNNVEIINDKRVILKDIIISGYFEKKNIYHNKEENAFYDDFSSIDELNINNKTKPKILILHSPEPFENDKNISLVNNYDVILCGHYHNGCVPSFLNKIWFPKNGGIITYSKRLFPKNVRGIKKLSNGTYLIYNGGWTKISNNTPSYLHMLDKLCNRQLDITILTKDYNCKDITIKTKKIKKK